MILFYSFQLEDEVGQLSFVVKQEKPRARKLALKVQKLLQFNPSQKSKR